VILGSGGVVVEVDGAVAVDDGRVSGVDAAGQGGEQSDCLVGLSLTYVKAGEVHQGLEGETGLPGGPGTERCVAVVVAPAQFPGKAM
jgi:hypothetical protein